MWMSAVPRLARHQWEDESSAALELADIRHLLFREVKVEHGKVLLDPGGRHRLGDDGHAALQLPADQHLTTAVQNTK